MAHYYLSIALLFSVLLTMMSQTEASSADKQKNYKPVVIIHGVNEEPSTLEFLENFIRKAHPGTDVHLIHILHGAGSFLPMWYQVRRFREIIKNITMESEDGIHLIGYSQGGLIARGVVATLPNHNIDTFISLAAPQLGQFGATDKKDVPCYSWIIKHLYIILYSFLGQLSSVGGYWKDPHHINAYRKNCYFLPVLNNETNCTFSEEFRENMLQLKRLVLIGSVNDTTITPWQSSQFGFYDKNGDIAEMKQQEVYTKDLFGLKTLDERGDLVTLTARDLDHQDLPYNVTFLQEYLLPWLT